MMTKKHCFALLLALTLLLSGCGSDKLASGEMSVVSKTSATQTKFTEEERNDLIAQVEYALLAATFRQQAFQLDLSHQGYYYDLAAHVGDLDQDGLPEMVYGYEALTFDLSDGYNANIVWEECGNALMTDKDGNLYTCSVIGSPDENGEYHEDWYKQWTGDRWEIVMSCVEATYTDDPSKSTFTGFIDDQEVEKQAWDSHLNSLALDLVETTVADFTTVTAEKKHRNAVQEDLFAALQTYHDCTDPIVVDIDDDNQDETFIAIRNPLHVWRESLEGQHSYQSQKSWLDYDFTSDYTVILVCDPEEDAVKISAHAISGYLGGIDEYALDYEDGYLCYGNMTVGLPSDYHAIQDLGSNEKDRLYDYILDRLDGPGYNCHAYKWTDLSASGKGELLCICEKDGIWYAILFTLEDGNVSCVWAQDLTNTACYLVNQSGKQYLLCYDQAVSTDSGVFRTHYSYELFRFDGDGYLQYEDMLYIGYTNNDEDATNISAFFDRFNEYFADCVIIGDPYRITGQKWADSSEIDGGNLPQESNDSRLGYVQIDDPASFLFLREGPGKEYDPVLIDPSNPDSYVKQALGAPVTILEEVETGDSENPVWVKLRINYGDREIVGYSSKRYIREAN